MREHPIPQDIVGYRFHIVGNMTIKQFAEIGAGVFVAFLLYQTNLLTIIKWPLMGISVAIGAALAFVPFEERPLDHWLTTFIRVLYKPTKFYWKRNNPIPDAFNYQVKKSTTTHNLEVDLSPARRERIKEYMLSLRQQQSSNFDIERQQSISDIMTVFSQDTTAVITSLDKPQLKIRVRNLGTDFVSEHQIATDDATIIEEHVVAAGVVDSSEYQEELRQSINLRTPLSVNQVAQEIAIPEQQSVTTGVELEQEQEVQIASQPTQTEDRAYYQNEQPAPQQTTTMGSAVYNQQLPFPSKPKEPNKLVGMVLSPNNDLINDAIVEIKNQAGATVRAVKTNALGQFFVTTPLTSGTYIIETEKDGFSFSEFNITLKNEVVDPIEIRSIV